MDVMDDALHVAMMSIVENMDGHAESVNNGSVAAALIQRNVRSVTQMTNYSLFQCMVISGSE